MTGQSTDPSALNERAWSALVEQVSTRLQSSIGLDLSSIGESHLRSKIRQRMRSIGVSDPQLFLELLDDCSAEALKLGEVVSIPETWFFRDERPFTFLARYVDAELLASSPRRKVRILSIPCATGEEPFSIAMALLTAGVAQSRFQIDAVDISETAIDAAQRGDFTQNSFRGGSLAFRDRYFEATPAGYRLELAVAQTVRFGVGNILDPRLPFRRGRYDIVFCRNLLIYLSPAARVTAFRNISNWLGEDGLLFMSVAELPLGLGESFSTFSEIGVGVLQRAPGTRYLLSLLPGNVERLESPQGVRSTDNFESEEIRPPEYPVASSEIPLPTINPARSKTEASEESDSGAPEALQRAKDLADRDELEAAGIACDEYLRLAGPCSEAYYVKALISSAGGNRDSISELLEKALYLDPDHTDSLVFLAAECDRRGERDRGRILRDRLGRIDAESSIER